MASVRLVRAAFFCGLITAMGVTVGCMVPVAPWEPESAYYDAPYAPPVGADESLGEGPGYGPLAEADVQPQFVAAGIDPSVVRPWVAWDDEPRFLPLPTQPVFGPPAHLIAASSRAAAGQEPRRLPTPGSPMNRRAPLAPPEAISPPDAMLPDSPGEPEPDEPLGPRSFDPSGASGMPAVPPPEMPPLLENRDPSPVPAPEVIQEQQVDPGAKQRVATRPKRAPRRRAGKPAPFKVRLPKKAGEALPARHHYDGWKPHRPSPPDDAYHVG